MARGNINIKKINEIINTSVEENDINFYDYDGTLLYSYTKTEFLALESMPANPSRTGLTAQGWNWSLTDAKEYVTTYGKLNIGQMYITSDGKTRIYITLDSTDDFDNLYFCLLVTNTIIVNWGEGFEETTLTGANASKKIVKCPYTNAGNYIITITPNSENATFSFKGETSSIVDSNQGYTYYGQHILFYKIYDDVNKYYIEIPHYTAINKVEIGEGISVINYAAFSYCRNLKFISLPNSISNIFSSAFSDCRSLQHINVPIEVGSATSKVTSSCNSLKSVSLPRNCKCFGFESCLLIKSITVPDTVSSLFPSMFSCCYNLESVIIPDDITTLPSHTFDNCYKLKSIKLPNTITSIGSYAFKSCINLKEIELPDVLTSLGDYAFQDCEKLTSIEIPSEITTIGNYTFSGCKSLNMVKLPSNLTTLSNRAFDSNEALFYLAIPSSLSTIGANVFANDYYITLDFSNHTTIPTLSNSNAFVSGNNAHFTIIVPDNLYNDWISTTNWSASHIVNNIIKASEA